MLRHKMDEIDGIWSCNGLKYGIYKIFDTFDSLILMGIKIYDKKRLH
jgi:hypothetical protein